jgi:hypothetical protein
MPCSTRRQKGFGVSSLEMLCAARVVSSVAEQTATNAAS